MASANDTAWKADLYKFVGKAFDYAYADRMNKLSPILGEVNAKSADYEISGAGGYGELSPYDGTNLVMGQQKRGFKTIITPTEFTKSDQVGRQQAKIDKLGETKKVGTRLGDSASITVYLHALRMFGRAFDPLYLGGDSKPWAAEDHPVASLMDVGRKRIPDPDAGVFSNLMHAELDVKAITDAQTMGAKYLTPDGVPFLCDMDTVLVSPALEAKAKMLFGETNKLRPLKNPEDNSNAANPVYDMSYLVVGGGNDGFKDKQWALCDRRLLKEMANIVYLEKPKVFNTALDNPLIDMYTAYVSFATGWGDARPIIFSDPKTK